MLSLRPDDEVVEVHRRDFAVQFVCDLPAQCHKRVIAAPSFTQVVCRSPCGSRSRNSRQHGHQFQATLEQPLLQRLGEAADGAGRILVEVFEVGAEVEDEAPQRKGDVEGKEGVSKSRPSVLRYNTKKKTYPTERDPKQIKE